MEGLQETKKKQFKIKIAGFTIKLWQIVAFALLIGVIVLSSMVQKANRDKEEEDLIAQQQAEIAAAIAAVNDANSEWYYDIHAEIQKSLTEEFGVAPEGFEWGYTGQLIALGNDDEHTCEDVTYMFLRALSILDFSTAQRYSSESAIISDYKGMYGLSATAVTSYYHNFLRKQFKLSLTSLEIEGISDTAVFADGTEYITIDVSLLNLTDKDFWEKDRDELFDQMYVYRKTEADNTKLEQYVYEYIYDCYEDGSIGKKTYTVELVVSKDNGSGWLVSGDKELSSYMQYEYGVDVASYIKSEFESWYNAKIINEQIAEINNAYGIPTSSGSTNDESGAGAYDPDQDTSGDTGEYDEYDEFDADDGMEYGD